MKRGPAGPLLRSHVVMVPPVMVVAHVMAMVVMPHVMMVMMPPHVVMVAAMMMVLHLDHGVRRADSTRHDRGG